MERKSFMKKIYASSVVTLDSNVITGGGTDVTDELQAILDLAPECGGVHLVLDGAALVRGLKLHSNTTIECPNRDCGLFMVDHTNRPLLSNYNWSFYSLNSRNITIKGGTFNHNCATQAWFVDPAEHPWPDDFDPMEGIEEIERHFVFLFEFYGVENFYVDGVKFLNQRGYTLCLGNFLNARVENSEIEVNIHMIPSNQDGFHIFGPGKFLVMKNLKGCTGDDFMNITPDELDGKSSITDVLVDGVFLDDTYQGIRVLSKKNGRLDRISFKNITGRTRTYGFSIIPFYPGENFGNVGDIYFENIDIRQIPQTYNYTPLTFMQLGGNFENVTMKNVRFHNPVRKNVVFDIGRPFHYVPEEFTEEEARELDKKMKENAGDAQSTQMYEDGWMPENGLRPRIKNFMIDGLTVVTDSVADDMDIFHLRYNIDNFTAKNIQVFRSDDSKASGNLIKLSDEAKIKNMIIEDVFAEKIGSVLSGTDEHSISTVKADNIVLVDGGTVFDINDVNIKRKLISGVNELEDIK